MLCVVAAALRVWPCDAGRAAGRCQRAQKSIGRMVQGAERGMPEEGCRDGVGRVALVRVVLQHQALVELGLVVRLVLVRCAQKPHIVLSWTSHFYTDTCMRMAPYSVQSTAARRALKRQGNAVSNQSGQGLHNQRHCCVACCGRPQRGDKIQHQSIGVQHVGSGKPHDILLGCQSKVPVRVGACAHRSWGEARAPCQR